MSTADELGRLARRIAGGDLRAAVDAVRLIAASTGASVPEEIVKAASASDELIMEAVDCAMSLAQWADRNLARSFVEADFHDFSPEAFELAVTSFTKHHHLVGAKALAIAVTRGEPGYHQVAFVYRDKDGRIGWNATGTTREAFRPSLAAALETRAPT